VGQVLAENIKTQASRIPDVPMVNPLELQEIRAALYDAADGFERSHLTQSVVYLTVAVDGLLTLMKREGHLEARD
jgi:hypothetical protein